MTIRQAEMTTTSDDIYMKRCIQLAQIGQGYVSPNPMVGAVVVYQNKIVGEGYHKQYGESHAEVNALKNVPDNILPDCTLYVNLEPCSHHGKTPPCADLIISKGIKRVVIGTLDPFEKVSGNGIKKLQNAGIETSVNHCVEQCNDLNKRFFTNVIKKRPFIILKYAQTNNGFIGRTENTINESRLISNEYSQRLTHRWRTEESSILVGGRTALIDNPQLDTRYFAGKSPIRIAIDSDMKIPYSHHIYDSQQHTIIFSKAHKTPKIENVEFINYSEQEINFLPFLLQELFQRNIQSILVEGGTKTLQSFIDSGLWDEARIYTAAFEWNDGIKAPILSNTSVLIKSEKIHTDILQYYKNNQSPCY